MTSAVLARREKSLTPLFQAATIAELSSQPDVVRELESSDLDDVKGKGILWPIELTQAWSTFVRYSQIAHVSEIFGDIDAGSRLVEAALILFKPNNLAFISSQLARSANFAENRRFLSGMFYLMDHREEWAAAYENRVFPNYFSKAGSGMQLLLTKMKLVSWLDGVRSKLGQTDANVVGVKRAQQSILAANNVGEMKVALITFSTNYEKRFAWFHNAVAKVTAWLSSFSYGLVTNTFFAEKSTAKTKTQGLIGAIVSVEELNLDTVSQSRLSFA